MSNITYRRDYNLIPTATSVIKEYENNSSTKSCGIENTYIINPRALSPHQFHLFSPMQNPRASQVVNTVWQKVTSSNDSHSIALLQSSTIHLKGSRTNESDEGLTLSWVRLPNAFKSSSMSNSTTRTTDLVQQIAAGSHVDSAIQFMNSTELEGPCMFRLSIETASKTMDNYTHVQRRQPSSFVDELTYRDRTDTLREL